MMFEDCAMRLAFRSLEDVYVRGRTVHFVGNDHRFYGNIECESAASLVVHEVVHDHRSLLGFSEEWMLELEIVLDPEMARNGRETMFFHFAVREHAILAREAFQGVCEKIREKRA